MAEHTRGRLVAAASDLLDAGGQGAVTLRAVADAVGVSHNAPYRHFENRAALLAGVAERDLGAFARVFRAEGEGAGDPGRALKLAIAAVTAYARAHPARYRLLFSDPDVGSAGAAVEAAALDAFDAFATTVRRCQDARVLGATDAVRLAGLIHAALHGAIDLELGGRGRAAKGTDSVEAAMDLLLDFLRP